MPLKDKNLTVVYTINNKEAFEEEQRRIQELMGPSKDKDWAITAWSRDHEIHRLALIEDAVNAERLDLIEAILALINVSDIDSIDDIPKRG